MNLSAVSLHFKTELVKIIIILNCNGFGWENDYFNFCLILIIFYFAGHTIENCIKSICERFQGQRHK